jgi:hypothetical protein
MQVAVREAAGGADAAYVPALEDSASVRLAATRCRTNRDIPALRCNVPNAG